VIEEKWERVHPTLLGAAQVATVRLAVNNSCEHLQANCTSEQNTIQPQRLKYAIVIKIGV
jgi:hypothetical protein